MRKRTPHDFDPRARRYFPSRASWRAAIPMYSDDGLELHGFQLMQTWERALMHAMAKDVSCAGGRVLEVGFGLGIAARAIRRSRPALHVIVESNKHIAAKVRSLYRREIADHRVEVIAEFWEEAIDVLKARSGAGFDGILFDTFPLRASQLRRNHYEFFPIASALLVNEGKFTYFSDEVDSLGAEHQRRLFEAFGPQLALDLRRINVSPPKTCEYWRSPSILHVVVTKRRPRLRSRDD
jgi:guanidinoacetate N-methyltransferase